MKLCMKMNTVGQMTLPAAVRLRERAQQCFITLYWVKKISHQVMKPFLLFDTEEGYPLFYWQSSLTNKLLLFLLRCHSL